MEVERPETEGTAGAEDSPDTGVKGPPLDVSGFQGVDDKPELMDRQRTEASLQSEGEPMVLESQWHAETPRLSDPDPAVRMPPSLLHLRR